MPDAVQKMVMQFVNVLAITMEIHMKDVDPNVRATPIVRWAKHASETNVKILALEFVALKQYVPYRITFRFVHARRAQSAMHLDNV